MAAGRATGGSAPAPMARSNGCAPEHAPVYTPNATTRRATGGKARRRKHILLEPMSCNPTLPPLQRPTPLHAATNQTRQCAAVARPSAAKYPAKWHVSEAAPEEAQKRAPGRQCRGTASWTGATWRSRGRRAWRCCQPQRPPCDFVHELRRCRADPPARLWRHRFDLTDTQLL